MLVSFLVSSQSFRPGIPKTAVPRLLRHGHEGLSLPLGALGRPSSYREARPDRQSRVLEAPCGFGARWSVEPKACSRRLARPPRRAGDECEPATDTAAYRLDGAARSRRSQRVAFRSRPREYRLTSHEIRTSPCRLTSHIYRKVFPQSRKRVSASINEPQNPLTRLCRYRLMNHKTTKRRIGSS